MRLGGLQKTTLIDFPGRLAATVFTVGCNLRCPWCHNGPLVQEETGELTEGEFFAFLRRRVGVLDGVVISGGEPTLQPDLADFAADIKKLGLAVKLDTNGTRPQMLKTLLEGHLLDFAAMDVKSAPERCMEVTGCTVPEQTLRESVSLIRALAPAYEFRATLVPGLHRLQDMVPLAHFLGSGPLFLQNFVSRPSVLSPQYRCVRSFSAAEMEVFATVLRSAMTGLVQVR